ncbi:MAG TPA: aminoacyl-tRNA hydrolase [Candidatus Baltobacteraceae bacterium]
MGLGNPGSRYERTRHNVGFMVIDELARRWNVSSWKNKSNAFQAHLAARNLLLIKPQTFMNASGEAVAPIAAWWKTPREQILVIFDDLDLPLGRLRLRPDGGSGGHNGVKSLIAELGGEDFPRLRLGIGRGSEAIDHVLEPFTADETTRLKAIIGAAADGVERWLENGTAATIQSINGWREPSLGQAET